MKLLLVSNDGEVLDDITISAAEFRREHANPSSTLSSLWPGENALENDDANQVEGLVVRPFGAERSGETTGVGELPEGSAIVEDLSAVQEQAVRRIIGERVADELNENDEEE